MGIKSKDDLERARLTRDHIEKWVHLPDFSKIVSGCFVRIGIGQHEGASVYRIAEILEVCDTPKVYNVGRTRTNKGFKLRHGQQERVFRLEFISNQRFTEAEFDKWRETVMLQGMVLPTTREVEIREKQIKIAMNKKLGDNEINYMLKEKEKFMQNPRNYAVFKSKLKKEIDTALAAGQEEVVEKLTNKLNEIEERAEELDRKRSSKISSIALINDKNRKKNIERAEQGIKLEMERMKKEGQVSDPFTRRKTQPTLATAVLKKKDPEIKTEIKTELPTDKVKVNKENEYSDKPETKVKVECEAQDLFNAHDFDITIDLDVSSNSSSTSVNLKPVSSTKQSSGPKKSLNLADYKKKRGLI